MNPTSIGMDQLFRTSMVSRRFIIITVMFLSVLLCLLIYTVSTMQKDQSMGFLIDVAGHQRMFLQKHFNEMVLTSHDISVDYTATRQRIRSTLNALMDGGSVATNSETNQRQTIPSAPTQEIYEKLLEQQNHIQEVFQLADDFLLLSPNDREFRPQLETLRTQHEIGIHIADEAVKQLDQYSEDGITTMLRWEILITLIVGLLGIVFVTKSVRDGRKLEKEIDERKRVDSALRNNEMFLNSIVENIPHMIFVKDARDLRFLRWNKAGEALIGYPNEALIGKTDYDFFPQSEADFYTTKDREVLTGKKLIDIPEEVIQTKSHGTRYLHTKKIPILDSHGNPEYLLGISEDITEWKQTEERIRKGERKFRAMYEQAPTGIAILDSLSGRFTQINRTYCDIVGYSEEEMLNLTFQDITHPDDLQTDLDWGQQLISGKINSFRMEKRYFHKNGAVIWVNLICVSLWLEPTDLREHMAMVEDITYRKQGEKSLQESEERFRILYEDNPSMYFTVSQDGIVLSVNRFGAQQLGYTGEELVGQPVIDLFIEEDKPFVQQRFAHCLKNSLVVHSWEFRKVRKDKSIVWVKEVARAVRNNDGEFVVLLNCEDISERKKTENALQEWQALTESILGQLPKGFAYRCLNDKSWPIIYTSNGIEEVTGYPIADLLGGKITYNSLMPPGENERVWPIVQEALAKRLPYENEHQIITRDGKKKWILARGRFIFDETGRLLYLDGLNVDITEHKENEEKLRASEAQFRTLVNHIPFCIHEIELSGKMSSMNKAGQKMLEIENESQVIGRSYLELADKRDQNRIRNYFSQAVQGQSVDFELHVTTDGIEKFFNRSFIPIRGDDGNVSKIVGISEDITERKQAEEHLRESESKRMDALRQSDELKSALLASVSHELRTPLTAMKASASSILGTIPNGLDEVQQEFLKGIDQEINYLSRLVDNLLDMSQIEAGTLVPHREWHPLEDLVESALRHTEQMFKQQNIEIHLPRHLPLVYVDAIEIQQVLSNLFDNAVKYSPLDSPIQFHVHEEVQQIMIQISNEGGPIPEEDLEQIFDRFYRRRLQRDQSIRGTGLGLAICKGIVEAHGGQIWCESTDSRVIFTLSLPVTESMEKFSLEGLHKG